MNNLYVCIHTGPTEGQSVAESGVTYSSGDHSGTEVESMDNTASEVQASTRSNATTPNTILSNPNSKYDEALENCSEVDKASEASQSPRS